MNVCTAYAVHCTTMSGILQIDCTATAKPQCVFHTDSIECVPPAMESSCSHISTLHTHTHTHARNAQTGGHHARVPRRTFVFIRNGLDQFIQFASRAESRVAIFTGRGSLCAPLHVDTHTYTHTRYKAHTLCAAVFYSKQMSVGLTLMSRRLDHVCDRHANLCSLISLVWFGVVLVLIGSRI